MNIDEHIYDVMGQNQSHVAKHVTREGFCSQFG